MMDYRLRWSPHARADLIRLQAFLNEKSPAAAWRALKMIYNATEMLKSHPHAGKRLESLNSERQLIIPFAKMTFILRYRLYDGEVVILRIWDSRENWPYDA